MSWETKISTVALNTADKWTAVHRLVETREEREKEHNGIIPPKPVREAASRSLSDLLNDYLVELQSRERRPNTVRKYRNTLRKLFGRCRWERIADVTGVGFCRWRNHCGLSAKTTNDLLSAAFAFIDWLECRRLVLENPFKHARRADTRGKNPRLTLKVYADVSQLELSGGSHKLVALGLDLGQGA